MEGIRPPDPFTWDEDAVTSELCALSRPCSRNLDDLAERIRENGIDGYTLLTHDLMGGAFNNDLRNELLQSLNVKIVRHKNALGEAIMILRRRSRLFQQWKLDNLDVGGNEGQGSRDQGQEGSISARMTPQSDIFQPRPNTAVVNETELITPSPIANPQVANATASDGVTGDPRGNENAALQNRGLSTNNMSGADSKMSAIPKSVTPTKQLKRKRVAPQLLQDEPVNSMPIPLATEADFLSRNRAAKASGNEDLVHMDAKEDKLAYLGKGIINTRDVKSSLTSLTNQLYDDGETFSTPIPTKFPPGKRLVINKIMRHSMIKNNRAINAAVNGEELVEIVGSYGERDKILDLDDLPDELDEETRKEMEEERAERDRRLAAAPSAKNIAGDRVRQILNEERLCMKNSWNARKLPKHEIKAHALWTGASRRGERNELFAKAARDAGRLDERIKKLEAKIMEQQWTKERDIRLQAQCLEQSVEDMMYHSWLASIFGSRFEPLKPLLQPKRRSQPKPKAKHVSSDEELLTSSDEDSFIVDEDTVSGVDSRTAIAQSSPGARIKRSQSPVQAIPNSPIYIDLTQIESSGACTPTGKSAANGEDLEISSNLSSSLFGKPNTDQIVGRQPAEPPPSTQTHSLSWTAKYHDVKDIANYPPTYWSKQKDRYALVISLLWRLGHARRSAVLKHVQQTAVDDSFRLTIARHIESPIRDIERLSEPGPETLAFDVSRLFLCFLKVKNLKESRLADLKRHSIERLKAQRGGNSWAVWHEFLIQMAPLFPQDNQIWRDPDMSDGEPLDDDDAEGEAATKKKSSGKAAPKEIVQNKAAVDLRERELRRVQEQEARALRLRASLGSTSTMPGDKSRLIINESKQDDQSFIYINHEIGKRIKDHQIQGVRFMWNQIIQDPALRQGCLLSHSMGLGKTMQVITLLVAIQESSKSSDPSVVCQIPEDLRESKTLVVCPAGLVKNWIDEVLIWDGNKALGAVFAVDSTLESEERAAMVESWSNKGGVLIIGYNMLKKVHEQLGERSFLDTPNLVVADEAHILKNPKSQNNIVCSQFQTKSRIAMTGSPLANNIEEYYAMIDWVAPNFLGPLPEFREIYANPIQQGVSNDSDGGQKRKALKMLQALKQTVAPKVHRATVKTCMEKDLPPKREYVLCLKPKPLQVKVYNLFSAYIRGSMLGVLSQLGLLCNHPSEFLKKAIETRDLSASDDEQAVLPRNVTDEIHRSFDAKSREPSASTKVEMLIQILDHARKIGDKVLVFSQSIPTLNYLATLFEKQKRRFSRLDGQTPIAKRQEQIKTFNTNEEAEFYLISTKAGGVGLNIQSANRVVIFDFLWNPVHEQQAVGRAYRIGQTKPVTVYYFVTAGTFEQDLHVRAVFKAQLAARVVDKKNPISWGSRRTDLKHNVVETKQKDLTGFFGQDRILDLLIQSSDPNGDIREIIPTDTFEEEDEKAPLSMEEQKEADDMVRMHQLRHSNQEELQNAMTVKANQLVQHTHRPNNIASPVASEHGAAPAVLKGIIDTSNIPSRPASEHIASPRPLAPTPQVTSPVVTNTNVTNPAVSQAAATPREAIPQPVRLMPIPGAQTFFSQDTQNTSTSQEAIGTNRAPSTPTSQPTPPATAAEEKDNPFNFNAVLKNMRQKEFGRRMKEKLTQVVKKHPSLCANIALAADLEKTIDKIEGLNKDLKRGFLPDNQRWSALTEFVSNDRFVGAVASGLFSAEYLASTNIFELQRSIVALNTLHEEEFDAKLRAARMNSHKSTLQLTATGNASNH